MKVLLVQLASSGDCLFVTAIAKQIKEIDYPGCKLTWMIGSKYKYVISNNPYVDEVIEVPLNSVDEIQQKRDLIDTYLNSINASALFDHIFITDFTIKNRKNWFGTTRSSLIRNYPKLKVNPQPLVFLTEEEVANVDRFWIENQLINTFTILFECSPQSGQSPVTPEIAIKLAEEITAEYPNIRFVLSSAVKINSTSAQIIDGSVLSWRENAELANRCQLVVGCSSGISWLCISAWVKPIPMVQIIDPTYFNRINVSASMEADFMYWGADTSNLIELYSSDWSQVKTCISMAASNKFDLARKEFAQVDVKPFMIFRFLAAANITTTQKFFILFKVLKTESIIQIYRLNKPDWFTPLKWLGIIMHFR